MSEPGLLSVAFAPDYAATGLLYAFYNSTAGNGDTLQILIEKDLECLDPAPGESQEDAFPHPQTGPLCAGRREQELGHEQHQA